jgi:FixJ family two-component response regulator
MKAGAVEFLTKPVRHQDLLDATDWRSITIMPAATSSKSLPDSGPILTHRCII